MLDPSQWVNRHGDALYRFALARLRNADLAENAVQETFVAALRARESFRGSSSERTWLIGILKRKVIDHFRKSARERPLGERDGGPDPHADLFDERGHWKTDLSDWGDKPDQAVQQGQFWRVLQACLDEIPERQARAFLLREVDGLEADELCKLLGVTETNLWVILHRARGRLRRCLDENWFAEEARRTEGSR